MPSTVSLPAIALSAASPADVDTDLLAVPIFEGDDMAADLRALDGATGGALMRAQESRELQSQVGHTSYGWGVLPVHVRILDTEWDTSLFPKDGRYIVPVKARVRSAEHLDEGDTVTLTLTVRL